jgi:hypothetical protein
MGFLGKLTKSVLSVAVTPIDLVVDCATLGGALSDRDKPYTAERLEKAKKALDESLDDLGDGDLF